VCSTLRRLWAGRRPALACTQLGHGQCAQEVRELAWATSALAHESYHLGGVRDEAAAECYGMQQIRAVTVGLGASRRYAERLTRIVWRERYPNEPPGYSSPQCHNGGNLDLNPDSQRFP
jgi:hypothetical protein